MDHTALVVLLWTSGLWAEGALSSTAAPADVRLVGGASRCAGSLEEKHDGGWRAVVGPLHGFNMTWAAAGCRQLDCGSVLSLQRTQSFAEDISKYDFPFEQDGRLVSLVITCSDSVRLVDGKSLCSGRLEVKSGQLWSSVCEDDFGLQDAAVVCRELGCGSPSVLKGGLYGKAEAPDGMRRFQCEGHESALRECDTSAGNTCSAGKAVGLSCLEPGDVRLVGGAGRCDGSLEIRMLDEWTPGDMMDWNVGLADAVCGKLHCGSAVSTRRGWRDQPAGFVWDIQSDCVTSFPMKCDVRHKYTSAKLEITCSDSVRLVDGTSLCSGRLEVKSGQLWSSVCEDDFDLQDAAVVCRELGCGSPSVFKGGLYGKAEAPDWMRRFQCEGHESALLDCRSSGSAGNTCSLGGAVGLTCSDPDDVRLVGGASRCSGRLELRHGEEWRAVDAMMFGWDLKVTAVMCRLLHCGSSVSTGKRKESAKRSVWWISPACVLSKATLRECVTTRDTLSDSNLEITCSDSVRLVNGTSLCSGRLEVKSGQLWSSVCEDDFDLQDAEVVCRELGCGAPSLLQGALYGEAEATVLSMGLQCKGHESSLLDCRRFGSPCKAVGLTCSDATSVRLVGGNSRCTGTLEMQFQREWRPVADWDFDWSLQDAAAVCRLLDCGFAVSTEETDNSADRRLWWITSSCFLSTSALLDCVLLTDEVEHFVGLEVICSDVLAEPNVLFSPSTDGVSRAVQQGVQVLRGSSFTITCSMKPQYEGGSFQLIFTTSDSAQNFTQPAVNHAAHFLFPAADHAHQGDYACVYHIHVFSQHFSSKSQPLHLTISASLTELIIRLVVVLLGLMSLIAAVCFHSQARSIRDETHTSLNTIYA